MTAPPGARARFPHEQQAGVAAQVRATLRSHRVGFAHGSLASGADIIIAEIVLEFGAELHVVLPFAIDEFIAISVEPAGPDWITRFRHCLGAATSVEFGLALVRRLCGDAAVAEVAKGIMA